MNRKNVERLIVAHLMGNFKETARVLLTEKGQHRFLIYWVQDAEFPEIEKIVFNNQCVVHNNSTLSGQTKFHIIVADLIEDMDDAFFFLQKYRMLNFDFGKEIWDCISKYKVRSVELNQRIMAVVNLPYYVGYKMDEVPPAEIEYYGSRMTLADFQKSDLPDFIMFSAVLTAIKKWENKYVEQLRQSSQ